MPAAEYIAKDRWMKKMHKECGGSNIYKCQEERPEETREWQNTLHEKCKDDHRDDVEEKMCWSKEKDDWTERLHDEWVEQLQRLAMDVHQDADAEQLRKLSRRARKALAGTTQLVGNVPAVLQSCLCQLVAQSWLQWCIGAPSKRFTQDT